jgi:methionine-rich copper-binding protein CopC
MALLHARRLQTLSGAYLFLHPRGNVVIMGTFRGKSLFGARKSRRAQSQRPGLLGVEYLESRHLLSANALFDCNDPPLVESIYSSDAASTAAASTLRDDFTPELRDEYEANYVPDPLWAPDTPQAVIDAWEEKFQAAGADINVVDGNRWTRTATNGSGLGQGHPSTITWSIMPDGTTLTGSVGEAAAPSDLRARLNGIYGSMNSWLPVFQQVFDRWEAVSGIDFVYEPNDDGAAFSGNNSGVLGVRGDIRIGGHHIDGNSGTLAYNFFPNHGDMVLDTADSFYSNTSNNSIRLRNTVAHELGHGLGLEHSSPTSGTKLMEPFISLSYDGPQHDDILRIHRGYGDPRESNDTAATASNIGSLSATATVISDVSIDDDADVDYFRFTVGASSLVNITLAPLGFVYTVGLEGGSTQSFDSRAQSDLTLAVLNSNATTVLATAALSGLGGVETVAGLSLTAGQYLVRVTGAQNTAQMYTLTAVAPGGGGGGGDTTSPTITNRTPASGSTLTSSSANIDVTFSEAVSGVDVTDLVLTGAGAAAAVKSTPFNIGGNTWRFAVSNLQNGSVNVSLAPNANDIEDTAGNDLAPSSWSYTVSIASSNQPPVLSAINDVTISSATQNGVVTLSASDPNSDSLTYSASAQSIEYHLDQTLALSTPGGNEYLNYLGRNEKWLISAGSTWYYITPDGRLYRWLGGSEASDPVVEQLSTASYANTALLYNAQPNSAPVSLLVSGNTLTINPSDSYSGRFVVTATVSDGRGGTDSQSFFVTVLSGGGGGDTTAPTITNRTPASGSTLTSSSANIDVTFSEAVSGVDITDLVLSGAGAAAAVKSAPFNIGGNTWRFAVSNLQNGTVNVSLAPDANDIQDAASNDLAPSNWSYTVSIASSNQPPVLGAIGNRIISSGTQNGVVALSASDPNGDSLTYSASAQSIEYHLDQTLGLSSPGGNEYFNWGGRNEKWFIGAGGLWYYITPNGGLYRWLGGSLNADPLVEQLSTADYANTALLHSAQSNTAPVALSVSGSTLTMNPNDTYSGRFVVTVAVNDGRGGSDSETFFVTVL